MSLFFLSVYIHVYEVSIMIPSYEHTLAHVYLLLYADTCMCVSVYTYFCFCANTNAYTYI